MVYHIGIIDYLQEWNMTKRAERAYKVHAQRRSRKEISAVEPTFYRQRFLDGVKRKLNFNLERNKKETLWGEFYKLEAFHKSNGRTNSFQEVSINEEV